MSAARPYDVILFGPTGVTGREVARHLQRRAPELGLTWAVAGRDESRIKAALERVGADPAAILQADATDAGDMDRLATSATTIVNLVGPFARFGNEIYRACAQHGTHSVDPCGETDWIASMIDRWDDVATESGAIIVPMAGYEALPFDMGALYGAHLLHERTGEAVEQVDAVVTFTAQPRLRSLSDVVSGGTVASAIDTIRRGAPSDLLDPFSLDTPSSAASGRYDLRPRKHPITGRWIGPLFPSPYLNPTTVHRSASLLRDSGDTIHAVDFAYREGSSIDRMAPPALRGTAAAIVSMGMALFGLAARAPRGLRSSIADALARLGPDVGDGPRPEDLDSWSYRIDLRATDLRGGTLDVVVEGDGHPGYKSTSRLLGEAALALADPEAPVPDGAGFLTPATALGLGMLDRLAEAGLRFRPG